MRSKKVAGDRKKVKDRQRKNVRDEDTCAKKERKRDVSREFI
jgi:hypothetical protein